MSSYTKSLCVLSAAAALSAFSGVSMAGEFDGVTVNILTRPGYVIAGRLAERGKEFEAATGGKIVVTEVPFAEIFPKIQNDWSTGTNAIDVGVFAAGWGVELDSAGLLEDLTPYVEKDTKLDLNDVAPYFRDFGQKIGGKTKLLMVDGDFQMVYYRKDVLEKAGLQPPKTWNQYVEVASKIHGQDMNGDGSGDYGSCIFKKRNAQSYMAIQTVAASYVQTQGTAQGFHFDGATMKPIVNNEAWKKAFEVYKETGKYGPPEELNMDIGDTRGLFKAGRCGLLIEWGDPGTLQLRGQIGERLHPGRVDVRDRLRVEHQPAGLGRCGANCFVDPAVHVVRVGEEEPVVEPVDDDAGGDPRGRMQRHVGVAPERVDEAEHGVVGPGAPAHGVDHRQPDRDDDRLQDTEDDDAGGRHAGDRDLDPVDLGECAPGGAVDEADARGDDDRAQHRGRQVLHRPGQEEQDADDRPGREHARDLCPYPERVVDCGA